MVFTPTAYVGVQSRTGTGKFSTKSKICDVSEAATTKIFGNDAAGFSEAAEYFDNFCRYYTGMTVNSYVTGYVSTKTSTVEMVQD